MRPPDALAQLTLVPTSSNGRSTAILSGYRPHFRHEGQENGVTISLMDRETLHPGETCNVELRFHAPDLMSGRLQIGAAFQIAEGKALVGTGFLSDVMHQAMLKPKNSDSRVLYVDVDDTIIRTAGSKRFPIQRSIDFVTRMHAKGHSLYLWSRGGGAYAEEVAVELGIDGCFEAFLPKPEIILDDMMDVALRHCDFRHPNAPDLDHDEPCDETKSPSSD